MEKRLATDQLRKTPLRASWMLLLLAAVLSCGIFGCAEEENTDITQVPYPEPATTPWLFSIWGFADDDVWAVGKPGIVLHWDGTDWTLQTIGDHAFTDVWGESSDDVYAVGHGGVIYHWNGASWSRMDSGTDNDLFGIGRGPYDSIVACGDEGVIRRLNGSSWGGTQGSAYRYGTSDEGGVTVTVPTDTLVFAESIVSFTAVTPYAVAGDLATVIMENDVEDFDHQWWWGPIQDVSGSFIRAANADPVVTNNYVGNENGRLLQYYVDPFGEQTWRETRDINDDRAYPITAPHPITGLWLDKTNDLLYLTTNFGEIATFGTAEDSTELLFVDNNWLSDVWGTGSGDIWAVGKAGVILHSSDGVAFTEVADVPLPETDAAKNLAATDKFGRPVH